MIPDKDRQPVDKPMNILWIAPYPIKPGQHPAPWILMLAKAVTNAGHRLTILTPSPKTDSLQKLNTPHGYEVIILPYKGGALHLLSLFQTQIRTVKRYLRSTPERYDLIHVHGTEAAYASSLTGMDTPSIISIQGIMTLYRAELTKKLSKRFLYWTISSFYERKEVRTFRHFFCRTDWDRQFIRSHNNQADISVCWEILRPEFFDYTHPFTGNDILFMGGDNPLKALDHGLKAFDLLLANVRAAKTPGGKRAIRLHIVGSTNPATVREIIATAGLTNIRYEEDILIHGSLNAREILEIYKSCFCLYHPSLIDNSPNSVCEAQVAGLPVIANRVGGVPSLISGGLTGMLVEKEDLDTHVRALALLYNDLILQQQLSGNARIIARQRHDPSAILADTLSTYQKIRTPVYA
ncbi:MAG TPA: glycosyltransferase family 4 protein [Puia sp.]